MKDIEALTIETLRATTAEFLETSASGTADSVINRAALSAKNGRSTIDIEDDWVKDRAFVAVVVEKLQSQGFKASVRHNHEYLSFVAKVVLRVDWSIEEPKDEG